MHMLALPAPRPEPVTRRLSVTGSIVRAALFCTQNLHPEREPSARSFYLFFDLSQTEAGDEVSFWMDNMPLASGALEFRALAHQFSRLAEREESGLKCDLPIGYETDLRTVNLHPWRDLDEGGPDFVFTILLKRDDHGNLVLCSPEGRELATGWKEIGELARHFQHLADQEEEGIDLSDLDAEDYIAA